MDIYGGGNREAFNVGETYTIHIFVALKRVFVPITNVLYFS